VAKVNSAGTALLYCGYIGGLDYDYGSGIAVDSSGNAYVTGTTYSDEATFPVGVGPDLTYNGGQSDAFVAKISAVGAVYTLTIAAGSGGTTNPVPGGHSYDPGTQVTVTAVANSGYRFSGWSGAVTGTTNPITVTMDADKSINASFIRQYTLHIYAGSGGTTSPTPGSYTYDTGTQVTVTAVPNTGYGFSGWSGAVTGTTNPLTVTMDADKSIAANFILQYTLTIAAGTGGTTNPAPGSYTYDTGTQVTVTAVPNTGYRFSGWSGAVTGTTNPLTVTMDADKSITASFIRQYTLTIAAGTGGMINPVPGSYTYDTGTQVMVTAVPNSGYRFSGWSGTVTGTTNPIIVTMDADKSITANFIRQYTLTIAAGSGGTTNPAPGSYPYDTGTQVLVTAVPTTGYKFSGWSGAVTGTTNPITVTIDGDKSMTANFEKEKKGCFIATAAYGSALHPHVKALRDFRDKYLVTNKAGRKLVSLYYRYSPAAAEVISKYKILRLYVRIYLLPAIGFSYLMVHFGTVFASLLLVFFSLFPVFFIQIRRRKIK